MRTWISSETVRLLDTHTHTHTHAHTHHRQTHTHHRHTHTHVHTHTQAGTIIHHVSHASWHNRYWRLRRLFAQLNLSELGACHLGRWFERKIMHAELFHATDTCQTLAYVIDSPRWSIQFILGPSALRWYEWPPQWYPVTQEEAGFNLYIYLPVYNTKRLITRAHGHGTPGHVHHVQQIPNLTFCLI